MSIGLVYKYKTHCGSTIGHINPKCIGTNTHICLTKSLSITISKKPDMQLWLLPYWPGCSVASLAKKEFIFFSFSTDRDSNQLGCL